MKSLLAPTEGKIAAMRESPLKPEPGLDGPLVRKEREDRLWAFGAGLGRVPISRMNTPLKPQSGLSRPPDPQSDLSYSAPTLPRSPFHCPPMR